MAGARMSQPILEIQVGDRLRLRKEHPCGSREWQVVRIGADIGLRCERCGRRILLERRDLERRLDVFTGRAADDPVTPDEAALHGPAGSDA